MKWISKLAATAIFAVAPFAVQAQTVVEYIHTDALGSPVAVTDANQNVVERSEYEPFGQLVSRPLSDGPGYTGHVSDAATGLIYMQQRYYDPTIGRFLSVDQVTAYGNSDGRYFNRYWYAAGNPYKFTDPDGRRVAGGCTQDCTYVQMNYAQIPGAPRYVHAYIVVIPKDGSESKVVRAGPAGGRTMTGDIQAASPELAKSLGIKPDSRKLQATTSSLVISQDAKVPQAGSQTIVSTSASGGEVMRQLNRFKDAVNAAKINYDARGVNSNSFAFDAAQGLTGTRPVATPDPNNNALGNNLTTGVPFEPKGPNQ